MTDDAFASRSDLEALQSAGRGKVFALGALLLAALGGAGWYYFGHSEGIGSPEDPGKVLVVRPADSFGFSSILKDGGFDAAEGTLDHWVERARTEIPELEVGGVEAVMTLADTFGYGYIVFESPADIDFSQLEISDQPDLSDPAVEFAVVSVGDFAFPHTMTVNPPPSEAMATVELSLLGALFAQERLAAALPENDDTSMGLEIVQLRDRLADALDELAKLPQAEKLAEKVVGSAVRALVEGERAEPRPALLGSPLESSFSVSIAGGNVLTIGQTFSVTTRDGLTPVLVPGPQEVFLFGAPGTEAERRGVCSGDPGDPNGRANYALAPDGTAVVLAQSSGGLQALVSGAQGCTFELISGLTSDAFGGVAEPTPHSSGRIGWAADSDDGGVLQVHMPGRPTPVELGPVPFVEFERPVWIGSDHLAAVGRSGGSRGSLYLFSVEEPGRVLQIDASVFALPEDASGPPLYQLAAIGERTDALLATVGSAPRRLYRLDLPAGVGQLFAAPPLAVAAEDPDEPASAVSGVQQASAEAVVSADEGAEAVEPDAAPAALMLDPGKFVATALTHQGVVVDPVSSPDGTHAAFAVLDPSLDRPDASSDSEVALVPIAGGDLKLLTQNELEDERPIFTRDGRYVVMSTRLLIPKTRRTLTAARYVPVPAGS